MEEGTKRWVGKQLEPMKLAFQSLKFTSDLRRFLYTTETANRSISVILCVTEMVSPSVQNFLCVTESVSLPV